MNQSSFLCIWLVFLSLLSSTTQASAPERTAFEQAFIGKTWRDETFRQTPLSSDCIVIGGHISQQDPRLMLDNFLCSDERQLSVISERIGLGSLRLVIDAVLLPKPSDGEKMMFTGDCSLKGDTLTDFIALVHMGDRERVDWQTGVLKAWIPNVNTKKYEALSTRNIVCETPTPP